MPTWLELSKFQTKYSNEKSEWKELINECLMKTDILPYVETSEKHPRTDPNVLMNMRHGMVKSHFYKLYLISKERIKTDSIKLLREENHKKLLKRQEEKSVRTEIHKLQQILENHRFISKNVTENKIIKFKSVKSSKFAKPKTKFRKNLNFLEGICDFKIDFHMPMETEINENRIPFDVKLHQKRKEKNKNNYEDFLERISCRKGSVIEGILPQNLYLSRECEIEAGKKEIMHKFFRSEVLKEEFKVHNQKNDFLEDKKREKLKQNESEVKKESEKKENLIKIRIEAANKRKLSQAWKVWRVYTLTCQKRQKERTIYENKVDKFLTKLKEQTFQGLGPQKKISRSQTLVRKFSFRSKPHNIPPKEKYKEKDEKLQTILKSIEESQKEAHECLLTIEKKTGQGKVLKTLTNIFETVSERGNTFSGSKFLLRMEKRREERNTRRKEIEDIKRIRNEEKEKARREMEEEEKKLRQQKKRREFVELKEKLTREKELREREKKEREKFKVLSKKASDHYKKVLLRSYGLTPWLKLMRIKEERMEAATTFAKKLLTRQAFCTWAANVRSLILQKREKANGFYGRSLQKRWFRLWSEFLRKKMRQLQVAIDWQELRLTDWAFRKWLDFTQEEQLNNLSKQRFADIHSERKLKQKYMKILKNYPEQRKLQIASENRRRILRQKVLEILPDYRPMNLSINS